jgi:hypothetical protein
VIVEGELVVRPAAAPRRYTPQDSPLWACADEHHLWGRIVTDPVEVEQIRARRLRRRWPWGWWR